MVSSVSPAAAFVAGALTALLAASTYGTPWRAVPLNPGLSAREEVLVKAAREAGQKMGCGGQSNAAPPPPCPPCAACAICASAASSAPAVQGTTAADDYGWKAVHVYVGNASDYKNHVHNVPGRWHSAGTMDKVIAKLVFPKKQGGYFVDMAANMAVENSNTLTLERDFGWRGLCVEANPMYWWGLSHRTCDVVAAVVGGKTNETISFNFKREGLGGIVDKRFDNTRGQEGEERRSTVTLSSIFKRQRVPSVIDYLSLDVEGAELFIMKDFPFADYTILATTVERPKKELKKLMTDRGLRWMTMLGNYGDELWVHRSHPDLARIEALFEGATAPCEVEDESKCPPDFPTLQARVPTGTHAVHGSVCRKAEFDLMNLVARISFTTFACPKGCTRVGHVPECVALEELPEGVML